MKSATKRLKSQKRVSWTKFQNGSGEIAAISPSVNSNIWRRYFPANSIWHATSARYWREAWKWLNFRSETGFKTSDTKRSIALTRTRNKLSQILQCPWKVKCNFIPASSKCLAKMNTTVILVRSVTAISSIYLRNIFDNASTPFISNFSIYQSLLYCETFCWHHRVEVVYLIQKSVTNRKTINYKQEYFLCCRSW